MQLYSDVGPPGILKMYAKVFSCFQMYLYGLAFEDVHERLCLQMGFLKMSTKGFAIKCISEGWLFQDVHERRCRQVGFSKVSMKGFACKDFKKNKAGYPKLRF